MWFRDRMALDCRQQCFSLKSSWGARDVVQPFVGFHPTWPNIGQLEELCTPYCRETCRTEIITLAWPRPWSNVFRHPASEAHQLSAGQCRWNVSRPVFCRPSRVYKQGQESTFHSSLFISTCHPRCSSSSLDPHTSLTSATPSRALVFTTLLAVLYHSMTSITNLLLQVSQVIFECLDSSTC